MHRSNLPKGRVLDMDIQTLTLINKRTPISSHIHNRLLTQLPHSLVERLQLARNIRDILNTPIIRNNPILHIIAPKPQINEIPQQPRIDDLEFAREHTARVNVGGVGFKALVEAEDLGCRGGGHGGDEERVAETVFGDFFL